jgi:hypothetical protein
LALRVERDPMAQFKHLLDLKVTSRVKVGVESLDVLDQVWPLDENLCCIGAV